MELFFFEKQKNKTKQKQKKKKSFTCCWDLKNKTKQNKKKKTFTNLRSKKKKKNLCRTKIQPDPEIQWRNGNFWRKKLHPPLWLKKKTNQNFIHLRGKKNNFHPFRRQKKKKIYPTPTSMPPWKSNGTPLIPFSFSSLCWQNTIKGSQLGASGP